MTNKQKFKIGSKVTFKYVPIDCTQSIWTDGVVIGNTEKYAIVKRLHVICEDSKDVVEMCDLAVLHEKL